MDNQAISPHLLCFYICNNSNYLPGGAFDSAHSESKSQMRLLPSLKT